MKKLPEVLQTAFGKKLREEGMAQREFGDTLKWLRYCLDFCYKYRHPPRAGERQGFFPFLCRLSIP